MSMLLDVLLALLLLIFLYLVYRQFIATSEPAPRRSKLKETDFDEGEMLAILDERFELREREKELKHEYLAGKIDADAFRDKHKGLQLRMKEIERRLKIAGILD